MILRRLPSLKYSICSWQSVRNASNDTKVALIGACGGIGQPLALLLKRNGAISNLALYDIANTKGVAADLSHINSSARVSFHTGPEQLADALKDANIIVMPAGVPRKPGMTRDDLFNVNAGAVLEVAKMAANICPKAFLALITNPVNSTVPVAAQVFDPNRIFGVTTLDIVRAQTFVSELKNLDVDKTKIKVIGGHSGITIIPLLSQTKPTVQFGDKEIESLTTRIQNAGTEVVEAKAGAGSATLSMAHAGNHFVKHLLGAYQGKRKIVQCTYVKSNAMSGVDYFASPVQLGIDGVEKILTIENLSSYEQDLVEKAIPELRDNIKKGVEYAKAN